MVWRRHQSGRSQEGGGLRWKTEGKRIKRGWMHLSPRMPLGRPTSATQMLAPGVAPEPPPGSGPGCSQGVSLAIAADIAAFVSAQSSLCLSEPARAPASKFCAGSPELLPGRTSSLRYA